MEANPLTILCGDALEQLRTLPDSSVHCCVTSPPYWGLRDYSAEGQLGLEKTPEEYVAKMVEVFREVRRVLRKDGTLWLNLGDSYASGEVGRHDKVSGGNFTSQWDGQKRQQSKLQTGLKPKDLCGIPWRVAFALQSDGWWLRSDIIWAKPNPMPESVTDRPTKAHEYIFLLTKNANYFYDAEAIKEKSDQIQGARPFGGAGNGKQNLDRNDYLYKGDSGNRNKRSVWTVATAPYPEAHFATYPPDLIKPCILAGTSAKGCCAKCEGPWERMVKASGGSIGKGSWHNHEDDEVQGQRCTMMEAKGRIGGHGKFDDYKVETIGWNPACKCFPNIGDWVRNPPVDPCTVLDPFAGSGTTGAVALELGRKAILIELNPTYVELIKQRCNVTMGLALA